MKRSYLVLSLLFLRLSKTKHNTQMLHVLCPSDNLLLTQTYCVTRTNYKIAYTQSLNKLPLPIL